VASKGGGGKGSVRQEVLGLQSNSI
jgi:hypothetical protein